jgi:hypothetical protein
MAASAPAISPRRQGHPSGTIRFHDGSGAFLAGVEWAGALYFRDRSYPLEVSGLSVGAIGVKSYDLRGTVYAPAGRNI